MSRNSRRTARSLKSSWFRPEALESRELLASIIALTLDNHLLRFDSASPNKILRDSLAFGLATGDVLQSVAIRPQTGQLFGLGAQGRFYGISTRTGSSAQIGPQFATPLAGTAVNMVVNPVTDAASLVTNTGQNATVNPSTGIETIRSPLPPTARVAGIAFDHNNPSATVTAFFGLDYNTNNIVSLPDPTLNDGSSAPATVGSTGVNILSPNLGFAIAPDGTAFAVIQDSTATDLYTINLTTGAATLVGTVGDGKTAIASIAVERSATAYGIATDNSFVTFTTDSPGAVNVLAPAVTGLAASEIITSLDFEPASGDLFGLGSTGQVYRVNINPAAGAVGSAIAVAGEKITGLTGTSTASYDPVTGSLHVVTTDEQNARITGTTVTKSASLAYAFGDAGGLTTPNIAALANQNPVNGSTGSTLFGIDIARSELVTIGSTQADDGTILTPTATGLVFSVGRLGVIAQGTAAGFAINTKDDGFAVLTTTVDGVTAPHLYRINLDTGAAAFAGTMGNGIQLTSLALAAPGVIRFDVIPTVSEPAVGAGPATATITVTRSFGDTTNTADIRYASTAAGTAKAGVNFTSVSGQLSFGVGEYSKTFTVPILNDGIASGPLTIGLTLSRLPGGLTRLGGPIDASGKLNTLLTLNNTGGQLPGSFGLIAPAAPTKDADGTITVTVHRNLGAGGTTTVGYAVTAGTAIDGTDFTAASGTLTFGPGVTDQTISIPVKGNPSRTSSATLVVTLTKPTGGASLDASTSTTISLPAAPVVVPPVTTITSITPITVGRKYTGLSLTFSSSADAALVTKSTSYVLKLGKKVLKGVTVSYDSTTHVASILVKRLPGHGTLTLIVSGSSSGGPLTGDSVTRTIALPRVVKKQSFLAHH